MHEVDEQILNLSEEYYGTEIWLSQVFFQTKINRIKCVIGKSLRRLVEDGKLERKRGGGKPWRYWYKLKEKRGDAE